MRTYLVIALLLFVGHSFSQNTLSNSLIDAQKSAIKENKMIMLVVQSLTCNQCNEVAEAGIKSVRKKLEDNCVIVSNTGVPSGVFSIPSLFIIPKDFFGVIWFDKDFNPLSIKNGSTTFSGEYVKAMEVAKNEAANTTSSFQSYKEAYYKEVKSFSAAYNLLNKIKSIGFEPEGFLIDELVQKAPLDSATSLSFLSNVMRFAPLVGSIAFRFVEKNRDNYNMAWYRMDLRERVSINQRLIWKSTQKAIAEKNPSYAYQVAAYNQATYSDKPEEGARANMKTMLDYYKGINDTASYMRQVFNFYDRYYMQLTVADVKREDSLMLINARRTQSPEMERMNQAALDQLPDSIRALIKSRGGIVAKQMVSYAPKAQFYASSLNDGAWTIYQYTDNITHLTKALQMARKALEFFETPEVADTYARLLYKTGNKMEAINWQKKAIELNNKRGYGSNIFETVLRKMEKGEVKID
jgi:tetratricopeptide (TPR) repeat protein